MTISEMTDEQLREMLEQLPDVELLRLGQELQTRSNEIRAAAEAAHAVCPDWCEHYGSTDILWKGHVHHFGDIGRVATSLDRRKHNGGEVHVERKFAEGDGLVLLTVTLDPEDAPLLSYTPDEARRLAALLTQAANTATRSPS